MVNVNRISYGGEKEEPEAYAPALRRYFMKRADAADVEDLVQDVLMRMHARQSAAPIENFGGYIFTVASHTLKERRMSARARAVHVELDPIDLIDTITPERLVLGRREINMLISALELLPEKTRRIFVAHRFKDRTYAALARENGISVSAIEKHIAQALRLLSQALGRSR